MADIDYGQVNKDVALLTKQDPTLTPAEARAQSINNQRINSQLSSFFGVSQGSQVKNLKPGSATIKSQFGAVGEEVSVAITKSQNQNGSITVPFPFDEQSITVPDFVPTASKADASRLGSISGGFEDQTQGLNQLATTQSGMFGQTGTAISSVLGGVGNGLTSTINSFKSGLNQMTANIPTGSQSSTAKTQFAANPMASLDQQLTAFKTYLAQDNGTSNPFFDQLKSKFGELTNNADSFGRVPQLSTLADKSLITNTQSSSSNLANVIPPQLQGFGSQTSQINTEVLQQADSRAQLFPADKLEEKFKSLGNALAPQAKEFGQGVVGGLNIPGVSNTPKNFTPNEEQVSKDIVTLQRQDPTLTTAEARDQSIRSQQLNSGLSSFFGVDSIKQQATNPTAGIKI